MLGLGGALGTIVRYEVNGWVLHQGSRVFPWVTNFPLGTFVVNVSGCFLIGFLAAITNPSSGRVWIGPELRDLLMIGFCGGYTTFSSYGIQTLNQARDADWYAAAVNILGSNVIGLFAVFLGNICGLWFQAKLRGSGS